VRGWIGVIVDSDPGLPPRRYDGLTRQAGGRGPARPRGTRTGLHDETITCTCPTFRDRAHGAAETVSSARDHVVGVLETNVDVQDNELDIITRPARGLRLLRLLRPERVLPGLLPAGSIRHQLGTDRGSGRRPVHAVVPPRLVLMDRHGHLVFRSFLAPRWSVGRGDTPVTSGSWILQCEEDSIDRVCGLWELDLLGRLFLINSWWRRR
jgi:hypothetical protein